MKQIHVANDQVLIKGGWWERKKKENLYLTNENTVISLSEYETEKVFTKFSKLLRLLNFAVNKELTQSAALGFKVKSELKWIEKV